MSKSTIRTVIISISVLAVALLAYSFLGNDTPSNGTNGDKKDVTITPADHIKGNPNATVTLVEFGDLQCPACQAYEPIVRELMEKHGNEVRFVFKHFPLSQIHPNALLAAKYAEAAGMQGKFWEFHDMLYDKQKEWANSLNAKTMFETYGAELGLNVSKLTSDSQNKTLEEKILAEYREGVKLGVQGTPTFFVNGRKIENPRSLEAFEKILMDAKAEVTQ